MLSHLISPLSIAPMIDWTYSHFRVFMRLLAPQALLYTDMQTIGAIRHNPLRALHFHPVEKPLALQLGGSDPNRLAECAMLAEQLGFAEVNINLGCPSERVKAGNFGACLMMEPSLVANCIRAAKQAVSIPVTAKTRIGIDAQDSYEFFADFVRHLIDAGCDKLIVHARKAWLHGLSPKQNRTIPPLHYEYAYQIKQVLPKIPVVINGNIQTSDEMMAHLNQVDGVMLGRLACQNPYAIAQLHHVLYPEDALRSRVSIIEEYSEYMEIASAKGTSMSLLLKPLYGMAFGLPGARFWKEHLMIMQRTGEFSTLPGNLTEILVN